MKIFLHKKDFFAKNKAKERKGVTVLADFRKYYGETRVIGRAEVGGGSVLGRIRFFDESYAEGSILCVHEDEVIDRETLLLCPPLAIIVFCKESLSRACELCSLGVPCVAFTEGAISRERCRNKVALLDVEHGFLTLDPSIDTIELYSSASKKRSLPELSSPIGGILDSVSAEHRPLDVEHFIVSDKALSSGDVFFESAVSLWERLCPEALTVELSVPSGREGSAREFSLRAEELFRAALYGNLSLSLCAFDCEDELAFALRLLHEVFCLLEIEGREFNGYLPRGITLSSPLWLMRPSPVTNPDFIVLDFDSIIPSLFSLSPDEVIKKEKALEKELFSVLERYLASFAPRCDISIKGRLFLNTRLLPKAVSLVGAKVLFI